MEGPLACLNGGQCLSNGLCECSIGYSGASCENCQLFLNYFKRHSLTIV